jgi:hypothetical protein
VLPVTLLLQVSGSGEHTCAARQGVSGIGVFGLTDHIHTETETERFRETERQRDRETKRERDINGCYSRAGTPQVTASVNGPVLPTVKPLTSTFTRVGLAADRTGMVSELCTPQLSSTVVLQELQPKPHDSRASYARPPKLAVDWHVSTTACWPVGTDSWNLTTVNASAAAAAAAKGRITLRMRVLSVDYSGTILGLTLIRIKLTRRQRGQDHRRS